MADTTFVDNSTVIVASWLNDINNTVYSGLGGEQTASGIRTHLGLGTAALTNTGTSAGNTVVLDGTAKLPAVDGSQLTNITATIVDVAGATGTLPVLHGGTGATTAGGARTNLGSTTVGDAVFTAATVAAAQQAMDVEVGVDVQAYDAATAKLDVDQAWTGAQRGSITTDNDGSFDMAAGNNFECTPTAGFTLTFTNITEGQSGNIYLVNGSNYAVAAHANTKVTSSFLTKVSATGEYWISYWSPDGTNVLVTAAGDFA